MHFKENCAVAAAHGVRVAIAISVAFLFVIENAILVAIANADLFPVTLSVAISDAIAVFFFLYGCS